MSLANCNGLDEITPGGPETYIDTKFLYINRWVQNVRPKTGTFGKIIIFALKGAFRDPHPGPLYTKPFEILELAGPL